MSVALRNEESPSVAYIAWADARERLMTLGLSALDPRISSA
jgi:hypothetical protein